MSSVCQKIGSVFMIVDKILVPEKRRSRFLLTLFCGAVIDTHLWEK